MILEKCRWFCVPWGSTSTDCSTHLGLGNVLQHGELKQLHLQQDEFVSHGALRQLLVSVNWWD